MPAFAAVDLTGFHSANRKVEQEALTRHACREILPGKQFEIDEIRYYFVKYRQEPVRRFLMIFLPYFNTKSRRA
jgi:hypothetical protein